MARIGGRVSMRRRSGPAAANMESTGMSPVVEQFVTLVGRQIHWVLSVLRKTSSPDQRTSAVETYPNRIDALDLEGAVIDEIRGMPLETPSRVRLVDAVQQAFQLSAAIDQCYRNRSAWETNRGRLMDLAGQIEIACIDIRHFMFLAESAVTPEQGWIPVAGAAKIAGVHRATIIRHANEGKLLDNGKHKRNRRIDSADLTRWMAARNRADEAAEKAAKR